MEFFTCMQTHSTCYRGTTKATPVGVLIHDTGAGNPQLKRYVQPYAGDTDYEENLAKLGKNTAGNDWNHTKKAAGLNAWVGKMAGGQVGAVQTMPWNYRPWGCGSGSKGSCNGVTGGKHWIQFEICDDGYKDKAYFVQAYQTAVELTAYLCQLYGLNPLGTVSYQGVTVPVILCHQEAHRLGLGSNHGDTLTWFSKFGATMEDFRKDVQAMLAQPEEDHQEEDEEMDISQFTKLMEQYRQTLRDNDSAGWSEDARAWAVEQGLITGNGGQVEGQPNYMWEDLLTREQLATVLYRFAQLMGKA